MCGFCSEVALDSSKQSPGVFWKKLPNNKPQDFGLVHLIEDCNFINSCSSMFNSYFTSSVIDEQILNFTEDDFTNHPSVIAITNRYYQLNE